MIVNLSAEINSVGFLNIFKVYLSDYFMKKENLFWKICFVVVIVLVIGFIYIQNNQKAEFKTEREARQDAELRVLLKHSCVEYNNVASISNDNAEWRNEGAGRELFELAETYDCLYSDEYSYNDSEVILDWLLFYCGERNNEILIYDTRFGVEPTYKFIHENCNLVVQSYNGIMNN